MRTFTSPDEASTRLSTTHGPVARAPAAAMPLRTPRRDMRALRTSGLFIDGLLQVDCCKTTRRARAASAPRCAASRCLAGRDPLGQKAQNLEHHGDGDVCGVAARVERRR